MPFDKLRIRSKVESTFRDIDNLHGTHKETSKALEGQFLNVWKKPTLTLNTHRINIYLFRILSITIKLSFMEHNKKNVKKYFN